MSNKKIQFKYVELPDKFKCKYPNHSRWHPGFFLQSNGKYVAINPKNSHIDIVNYKFKISHDKAEKKYAYIRKWVSGEDDYWAIGVYDLKLFKKALKIWANDIAKKYKKEYYSYVFIYDIKSDKEYRISIKNIISGYWNSCWSV